MDRTRHVMHWLHGDTRSDPDGRPTTVPIRMRSVRVRGHGATPAAVNANVPAVLTAEVCMHTTHSV